MKKGTLLLLALAGLLLAGCSSFGGVLPGAGAEMARSSKSRLPLAELSSADLPALTAGNRAFAFDLYRQLSKEDGNLFYSPHSISLALALAYAGARGDTAQQMADTLHYTLPPDRLHPAFSALDQTLATRGQGAKGKDGKGFRLNIVNAAWGQKGFAFLPAYLDLLAENYGAGLRLLDFRSAPEPSRVTINNWVSDQTENRIKDLVPPGAINTLTRLVLTNAVYFNAAWAMPFKKEATSDGPFHLLDGKTVNVPLMHQAEHYSYAKGDGYEAIELPYDGNELSMVVLLPADGNFAKFQDSLTAEQVDTIIQSLQPRQVNLTLPRWKFDSSFRLSDTLKAMGMRDAFAPDAADFSGIDGARDLSISEVLHKAFVAVDEDGTEAAAATAVIIRVTAAPAEPVTLTVDRPFIFLIRDQPTGAILFVGRVLNPAS